MPFLLIWRCAPAVFHCHCIHSYFTRISIDTTTPWYHDHHAPHAVQLVQCLQAEACGDSHSWHKHSKCARQLRTWWAPSVLTRVWVASCSVGLWSNQVRSDRRQLREICFFQLQKCRNSTADDGLRVQVTFGRCNTPKSSIRTKIAKHAFSFCQAHGSRGRWSIRLGWPMRLIVGIINSVQTFLFRCSCIMMILTISTPAMSEGAKGVRLRGLPTLVIGQQVSVWMMTGCFLYTIKFCASCAHVHMNNGLVA